MLEVQSLHAGYGQMKVLQGVDLNIQQGEIVALLGSNGAGKSTLNNNISGIYTPTAGAILFEGEDITGLRSEQVVQKGIIHVPEGRRIFPNISVRENLELGSYLRGQQNRKANLDRVVGVFPRLQERFSQLAGTLSGGEQQMLAIGRALMTNPKLLILDEATEGLAPLIRSQIWDCLANLRTAGQSILVVDKNIAALARLADRHCILEKGRVVWQGDSAALLNDEGLKSRYLGV